jgi:hypothetical protein
VGALSTGLARDTPSLCWLGIRTSVEAKPYLTWSAPETRTAAFWTAATFYAAAPF